MEIKGITTGAKIWEIWLSPYGYTLKTAKLWLCTMTNFLTILAVPLPTVKFPKQVIYISTPSHLNSPRFAAGGKF